MTLSLPLESPRSEPPVWRPVQKANPCLVALADRHYTRQKPGTPQFCRPGMNFALLLSDGSAGWVTWRPIPQLGRMDGLEAWECTFFRNEGSRTSSELVREATDLTYRAWGWPPRDGLITAVGIEQTARRRSRKHPPGWCFICAGWRPVTERDGKAWLIAPPPERLRGASR
jgi:hypothetical protein